MEKWHFYKLLVVMQMNITALENSFFVLSGKIRLGCCGGLNEKGLIGSHI